MVGSLFRRSSTPVPEPGQRVRLRAGRRRWRGNFRAVSLPYTDEGLGVVVRVVEEGEYREAVREGRRALGIPWPVHQIEFIAPSGGTDRDTEELPRTQRPQSGAERVSWWRRVFGG